MAHETNDHETANQGTGLVLGRFQPLHPGHLELISTAMQECGDVVVCIGSAQRAEPFTVEQRHDHLQRQLEILHPEQQWRIVDLVDPEPMDIWPEYVKETCGIEGDGHTFYRADKLPEVYEDRLQKLGFSVVYAARNSFHYMFPDGLYRKVNSASEIKAVYEELGVPIPYSFSKAEEQPTS